MLQEITTEHFANPFFSKFTIGNVERIYKRIIHKAQQKHVPQKFQNARNLIDDEQRQRHEQGEQPGGDDNVEGLAAVQSQPRRHHKPDGHKTIEAK